MSKKTQIEQLIDTNRRLCALLEKYKDFLGGRHIKLILNSDNPNLVKCQIGWLRSGYVNLKQLEEELNNSTLLMTPAKTKQSK